MVADLPGLAIRYSHAQPESVNKYQVLLIDNIGMLSSLYAYGTYAYIGGAFGKGLHNTLEAAVFGLPLFFGPAYQKFQEALDLVNLKVAQPVNNITELDTYFTRLYNQPQVRENIAVAAKNYVREQAGATDIILEHVHQWLQQV
jgi:3-deoxy-D-manno-octulosonic-acid transferase